MNSDDTGTSLDTGGRLLLFFGNSYVNGTRDPEMLGWCGRLARGLARGPRPVTSYNLGIRGETMVDLARRIDDEMNRRLRSDLEAYVIVSSGTNDTAREGNLRQVTEDTLAAMRRILESVALRVSLLVIGPPALPDPVHSLANRDLSDKVKALCAARNVPFVEIWKPTSIARSWLEECNEDDGFHPGAAGYAAFAEIVGAASVWEEFIEGAESASLAPSSPRSQEVADVREDYLDP